MTRSSRTRRAMLVALWRSAWIRWPLYCLLFLLAIEVFLRASAPSSGLQNGMQSDPALLWLPREGDPRESSFTMAQAIGQSGRTAVFVGDSSVYGHRLSGTQSFPAQVALVAPGRIRTLNLAAPGYSSQQSLQVLETVVPRERPELVVVANLWSDSTIGSSSDREQLEERDSAAFRFFFHANRALSGFATWRALLQNLGKLQPLTVSWGQRIGAFDHGQRRVAINDYAENLERISELAEQNGAEVLFVMLANEEDLRSPDRVWPWHPYRRVMEETALRLGHPLLHLPSELRATGLSIEQLFMDEMHPSAAGHWVIGRIIANYLTSCGWLAGKPFAEQPTGEPRPRYLDPLSVTAPGPMDEYREYSITGILKSPFDNRGGETPGEPEFHYLLEAVSVGATPQVVDSVVLPRAAAFVLTVSPPQIVDLRLSRGIVRNGEISLGAPTWLHNGRLDLTHRPAWALHVDAGAYTNISLPPLPDGWQQLLAR